MIKTYRKYMEPKYGEVAPEVIINPPELMDMQNPDVTRTKIRLENIARLVSEWQDRVCWPDMMALRKEDTFYERDGYRVPCRIYFPKEKAKGTLLYFHGGAWCMNDPELYDQVLRGIALFGGVKVIAPDYRLAPENPYPAAIEDCQACVLWCINHASELNIDPKKIILVGDSAGGGLIHACLLRDKKQQILKAIEIYPLCDCTPFEKLAYPWSYDDYPVCEEQKGIVYQRIDRLKNSSDMKLYTHDKVDYTHPDLSILYHDDFSRFPKTLIITAQYDYLRIQGWQYAGKLKAAGVPVRVINYLGTDHGFFDFLGVVPQAEDLALLIADEIRNT